MNSLKDLKEISSEYKVLYVEDDIAIAKTLIHYLSKFFKEVVHAQDGEIGLGLYKENNFDVVITDIMMPKLNGLDMSKQIKEINPNQNIIVISAYSEIENFLESIKLGIDGYIIKPIDYANMNKTLYKTVYKIKTLKDNEIYKQKLEDLLNKYQIDNDRLKQFMDVVDKVAIVSKTDLKGVITYANNFFSEISGYSKDELIGNTHSIVRHSDMSKGVYQELWETIQNGKTWEGTIKNRARNGEAYFVHAVIIPLFDLENNINEYIGIRFLTTDEELEKRKFKKTVMTNYLEFKKTNINATERIASLEDELSIIKHENEILADQSKKIESKHRKAMRQVEFYEKGFKEKEKQYQKILDIQKNNLQKISESHKQSLQVIEKQKNQLAIAENEKESKAKEIIKLNSELNEQTNIIHDMRDTIKNIDEDYAKKTR